jgi:hypothetical protein
VRVQFIRIMQRAGLAEAGVAARAVLSVVHDGPYNRRQLLFRRACSSFRLMGCVDKPRREPSGFVACTVYVGTGGGIRQGDTGAPRSGEAAGAGTILTLVPWSALFWLLVTVWALRSAAECERRLRSTDWFELHHEISGDTSAWSSS